MKDKHQSRPRNSTRHPHLLFANAFIMDIDIVEAKPSFSSSRRSFVPVDDAHPFDLDSYISNYEGIRFCLPHGSPQIAPDLFAFISFPQAELPLTDSFTLSPSALHLHPKHSSLLSDSSNSLATPRYTNSYCKPMIS
jgi:hypothetical protein